MSVSLLLSVYFQPRPAVCKHCNGLRRVHRMITDHENPQLQSRKRALMSIRQEIRTHSRMWVKMVRRAPSNSQSTGSSHKWRTLTYQLEPSETTAQLAFKGLLTVNCQLIRHPRPSDRARSMLVFFFFSIIFYALSKGYTKKLQKLIRVHIQVKK